MNEQISTETTNSIKKIQQLTGSVGELIKALNIKTVVNVDDAYGISLEKIVNKAAFLDQKTILEIFSEFDDFPDTEVDDVKREILRQKVKEIPQSEFVKKYSQIQKVLGIEGNEEDYENIVVLDELIPRAKLEKLSYEDWLKKKDSYLKECQQDQKILFLFDQELTPGGQEGIRIISEISNASGQSGLICGLLTHTVEKDNVKARWLSLSVDHGINRDRFIVAPKSYLSNAPELFVQALKYIALCPDFKKLKEKATEIIQNSTQVATEEVEKLDIYTLDHMIFHLPSGEGIWEPDMLFRLYSHFHRLESRKLVHDQSNTEIKLLASQLRKLSALPPKYDESFVADARKIFRQELYEDAEFLNKSHLPIELGDIFEDCDSPKKYVLIGQPCSLMVRPSGKREPDITHVVLAEIKPTDETVENKPSPFKFPLSCFEEKNEKRQWHVNLKRTHLVRVEILDLCVFNEDGVSRITVNKQGFDDKVAFNFRLAWQKRFKKAFNCFKNRLENLKKLSSKLKEQSEKNLLNKVFFEDVLFSGKIVRDEEQSIVLEFNCRRVGKMSQERATGLLLAYTTTFSRPAYELGLGEEKSD